MTNNKRHKHDCILQIAGDTYVGNTELDASRITILLDLYHEGIPGKQIEWTEWKLKEDKNIDYFVLYCNWMKSVRMQNISP